MCQKGYRDRKEHRTSTVIKRLIEESTQQRSDAQNRTLQRVIVMKEMHGLGASRSSSCSGGWGLDLADLPHPQLLA